MNSSYRSLPSAFLLGRKDSSRNQSTSDSAVLAVGVAIVIIGELSQVAEFR